MLFKDTPKSRSLAAVIERDAKAATGLNLARRACWYGGGFGLRVGGAGLGAGLLLAGLGYGLGKAGEGYASIIGNREIAERAAQTTAAMITQEHESFRAMLAATKLQAEVTVNGELGLKDGQQVTLANTTLHLDPIPPVHVDVNATVRAVTSAPDMRAAIFAPPPQAPDSTLRLDQDRMQPAAQQGAPRSPVVEPRPQLRAINAALPASPSAAPKLLRQASAPAPKACQIAQP